MFTDDNYTVLRERTNKLNHQSRSFSLKKSRETSPVRLKVEGYLNKTHKKLVHSANRIINNFEFVRKVWCNNVMWCWNKRLGDKDNQ